MRFRSESQIQTMIIKLIKEHGWYVIKIIKGNENGIPDLIACIEGKFIAIEVKAEIYRDDPFKQATAWQKRHYKRVRQAEGVSMIVSTVEQFKQTLIYFQVNLEKL